MVIGHPCESSNPDPPENINLNKSDIKRVNKAELLGSQLMKSYGLDEQFERTKSKISVCLLALKRLKNIAVCIMLQLKSIYDMAMSYGVAYQK